MALVRSFCFCCNLRSGSMFTAIYSLLASSLYIGLIMIRYVGYRFVEKSLVFAIVTHSTFAVFGLLAATAAVLIYAVYNDQPKLFVPWLVMANVAIVFGTGTSCWNIIAQSRHHQYPHPWEISLLVVHVVNTAITIYCLLCVVAQYQDLCHGKGTSQYYNRQRTSIHQTGIAGLVEEIVSGCDHSQGGVRNIGLTLEELHEYAPTPPAGCHSASALSEAPPAYSTLPRRYEQRIEQAAARPVRTQDQEIFIMGSSLAGVHSVQPPRYTPGAPPSYLEAIGLTRFLAPAYSTPGGNRSAHNTPNRNAQHRSNVPSDQSGSGLQRTSDHSRLSSHQSCRLPHSAEGPPSGHSLPFPDQHTPSFPNNPSCNRPPQTRVEFICGDMESLHI